MTQQPLPTISAACHFHREYLLFFISPPFWIRLLQAPPTILFPFLLFLLLSFFFSVSFPSTATMHLFEASSALSSLVPLMVFEVLNVDADTVSLTEAQISVGGITDAERIPLISRLYVVEPAVKQVVLTKNLHAVSCCCFWFVDFGYAMCCRIPGYCLSGRFWLGGFVNNVLSCVLFHCNFPNFQVVCSSGPYWHTTVCSGHLVVPVRASSLAISTSLGATSVLLAEKGIPQLT